MTTTAPSSRAIWRSAAPATHTGNWLALIGTVMYFLEWVAILGVSGGFNAPSPPGTAATTILHGYLGHSDAFAWASGWFGVVLLGRVLFAIGVRRALRAKELDDAIAEFGVLAMLAGVVFEASAYAVVMGAAIVADHHGSAATVAALDTVGFALDNLIWGATGLAILVLAGVMLRSSAFPKLLGGIGVVGGAILLIDALAFNAPKFVDLHDGLTSAAMLLWIWMIWTAVLLAVRAPRRGQAV